MTLIHNNYAYPDNIHKIATPNTISPYLQIIEIQNKPHTGFIIINLYMPSHQEDLHLITIIQTQITDIIQTKPSHNIILLGDFNRDIQGIGRHHNNRWRQPDNKDHEWYEFTQNLQLQYIKTNTTYTRQWGKDYTSTSLIDGYYIRSQNIQNYTSTTLTNTLQNSDHFPVQLNIPPNILISRKPIIPPTPQPRIPNTIPLNTMKSLIMEFMTTNDLTIYNLSQTLNNTHILPPEQWNNTIKSMDQLIENLSNIFVKTCAKPPPPPLTTLNKKQGGFLPQKLQSKWKKQLRIYHNNRKAIYIANHDTNWLQHPHIQHTTNNLENSPNPSTHPKD